MTAYTLLRSYLDNGDIHDVAQGYAEPGYENPRRGDVFFADWNRPEFNRYASTDMSRLADILERRGYGVEWLDEWYTCQHCWRAFRGQPDSYSWKMYGAILNECEPICGDCLHANPEWLADEIVNDPKRADTLGIDWAAHGWEHQPERFENGWHPGQDDRPEEIAGRVPEGYDFLFSVDGVGQFDVRFSLWIRPTVTCDECGGPVHPCDGVTDDVVTLCGGMWGNGCGEVES